MTREVVQELIELAGALGDPSSERGARAREDLRIDGGLSAEMTEWGLLTTLGRYHRRALEELLRDDLRGARVAVLLADSVPTAPLRAIALPLLRGATLVTVRPCARQTRFVSTIVNAMTAVESGCDLTADSDLVIAYGRDATLDNIKASLRPGVRFEGHGHGFGAVLVDDQPLTDALADAIAWDVCAYDQRGCLSPQVVFALCDGAELAERLVSAIDRVQVRFPRGALEPAQGAAVAQWQGALAASGARLLRGEHGSVASINRVKMTGSPGARNIAVVQAKNVFEIQDTLTPYAGFLSCIGVSSDKLVQALPRAASARVVPVGTMQDPKLDGPEDPRRHKT